MVRFTGNACNTLYLVKAIQSIRGAMQTYTNAMVAEIYVIVDAKRKIMLPL